METKFVPLEVTISGETFTIAPQGHLMSNGYSVSHKRWGEFAWRQVESSVRQSTSLIELLKIALATIQERRESLRALPEYYLSAEGRELLLWSDSIFKTLPDIPRAT